MQSKSCDTQTIVYGSDWRTRFVLGLPNADVYAGPGFPVGGKPIIFKSASNIEAGLSAELSENVCNAAYAAPRLTADITKAIAIRDLMNGMVFSFNADDQEENLHTALCHIKPIKNE